MMTREDNDFICRVEPGTPMNAAFKRYWLVAGLSRDFPGPNSDPKRSTLLGEDYVLFRDSKGRIGCLRELCCHRGASLCLGRIEDGGLRCIFHGWKFDVDGKILDMPNATDDRFKQRYRQPAFPVFEKGGLIFVYLGPKEEQPEPPGWRWLDFGPEQMFVSPVMYRTNYIQAIDGGADSSHLTTLHQDALTRPHPATDNSVFQRIMADAAPRFDIYPTEFGQFSAAFRTITRPDGTSYETCKTSVFAAPSTVITNGSYPDQGTFAFFTPVDSYTTAAYIGNYDSAWNTPEQPLAAMRYMSLDPETLGPLGFTPETVDREDRAGRENNWRQDRDGMRNGRFTGMAPFIPEDVIVAESMGAIYDRTQENLIPADQVVVRIRRILTDMARDVQEGRKPIGVRSPIDHSKIVVGEGPVETGENWADVVLPQEFVQRERVDA
jgi:phenylpropionate dioxygenase-like ring-hydroxylating dioxygenase large terminal subunit